MDGDNVAPTSHYTARMCASLSLGLRPSLGLTAVIKLFQCHNGSQL